MINEVMKEKKITKYRLAKNSGIPYSTVNDICNGKTQIGNCTAETVYRLAKELKVPFDELMEYYCEKRVSFELYKSSVCHSVKEMGDIKFIYTTLIQDDIRRYYKKKWYPESLYLLAMVDYLSRENDIPVCTDYDDIRSCKLSETIYPTGVLMASEVSENEEIKEKAYREAIPEFIRFNIVENEVRNVI